MTPAGACRLRSTVSAVAPGAPPSCPGRCRNGKASSDGQRQRQQFTTSPRGPEMSTDDWMNTFRPDIPSTARLYDYYLGGKDNYPADRELAERLLAEVPELRLAARA